MPTSSVGAWLPQLRPSPHISVRHEGADNQWMKVPPEQLTIWFGSHLDGDASNCVVEAPGTMAVKGGLATSWAATRVNPEQAPKVQSWTPTHLRYGEGHSVRGRNRHAHSTRSTGVVGVAREEGCLGNVGGPQCRRGRDPQCPGRGHGLGASERPIVPRKPGNAGRGKGPHFGALLEQPRAGGLA